MGYGGKLNIRPKYQREFVYDDEQQKQVIKTVMRGFPLNIMYWATTDEGYELLDGQQRTMSICKYATKAFSVDERYVHNLTGAERERFMDYPLTIYICSGDDAEKLEWFKTINIAGLELKPQEIRNAVYAGPWVTDAKRYFSRTKCPAFSMYKNYLSGECNRQKYLETAIKWISGGKIEDYMAVHQKDADAKDLWDKFTKIMEWVKSTFKVYRKEMASVDWGSLYSKYKDYSYDADALEEEVKALYMDEDIKHSGIYEYVLVPGARTDPQKVAAQRYLNFRAFSDAAKESAYERQDGRCPFCVREGVTKKYEPKEMDADHIIPWCEGGKTVAENCQMLCIYHNRSKGKK